MLPDINCVASGALGCFDFTVVCEILYALAILDDEILILKYASPIGGGFIFWILNDIELLEQKISVVTFIYLAYVARITRLTHQTDNL